MANITSEQMFLYALNIQTIPNIDETQLEIPDPDHDVDSLGGWLAPIHSHRLLTLTIRSWTSTYQNAYHYKGICEGKKNGKAE